MAIARGIAPISSTIGTMDKNINLTSSNNFLFYNIYTNKHHYLENNCC